MYHFQQVAGVSILVLSSVTLVLARAFLRQVLYVQGGHAAKQMATTNVLAGFEGRLRVLSRLRSALIRRNEGKYENL